MGADIVGSMKKRDRNIIGVAVEPAMPCPFCNEMKDVFERVIHEGRVILICVDCMDQVIEQVREQWKKEISEWQNG